MPNLDAADVQLVGPNTYRAHWRSVDLPNHMYEHFQRTEQRGLFQNTFLRITLSPDGTRAQIITIEPPSQDELDRFADHYKCSASLKSWFPEKEAVWKSFDEETNANSFAAYLAVLFLQLEMIVSSGPVEDRASKKAEYSGWVKGVLDPLEEGSPALRAECFKETSSRLGNCINNKLFGLYEMEKIIGDHQLGARNLPLAELHKELVPWSRLDVLHQEVHSAIQGKFSPGLAIEYLLTLFTKEPIRALVPNREIRPSFELKISDEDVQRIAKKISGDDKAVITGYLLTSESWKAALQRDFPEAYKRENLPPELSAKRDEIDGELSQLQTRLEDMMDLPQKDQDADGINALGEEMKSLIKKKEGVESQMRHAVNERLTREVQEKQA